MSKYTTELRFICERYAGLDESKGYDNVNEIIEEARPKIFDFNYPIFDETYRKPLETKIIRHFYTREIAAESVGLWKLWLQNKMCEIMPYYNQRYNSELITFNPLHDTDLYTTRDDEFGSLRTDTNGRNTTNSGNDRTITDDTTNVADGGSDTIRTTESGQTVTDYDDANNSKDSRSIGTWDNESTVDWHFESDTPQSTIADISDSTYATRAVKDTHVKAGTVGSSSSPNYTETHDDIDYDKHNTTDTEFNRTETVSKTYGKTERTDFDGDKTLNYGKITNEKENLKREFGSTDEWVEHICGKRNMKSYSMMLNEFRDTFLNIDMEIINDLNSLFFNLW